MGYTEVKGGYWPRLQRLTKWRLLTVAPKEFNLFASSHRWDEQKSYVIAPLLSTTTFPFTILRATIYYS